MDKRIQLSHGAGGTKMESLLKEVVIPSVATDVRVDVGLDAMDDASVVNNIVFTTDSYTVKPIFFPGGDIGRLAVSGTINDVSVLGANPIAISCALIIEEGFEIDSLKRILKSIRETCAEAGTPVITGDTKVVEKGGVDEIIVNTSGIGVESPYLEHNSNVVNEYDNREIKWLLDSNLREGDVIIVSGTIGDHGVAVISKREGYGFESTVKSDVAPLNGMIEESLKVGGVCSVKDPTRGGLSNALWEMCEKSNVCINIREEDIPVREGVKSACEMLGISPYEIGNEGKLVMGVVGEMADDVVSAIRKTKYGKDATIIGEVSQSEEYAGVVMETEIGGRRILPRPIGDPVPRIC